MVRRFRAIGDQLILKQLGKSFPDFEMVTDIDDSRLACMLGDDIVNEGSNGTSHLVRRRSYFRPPAKRLPAGDQILVPSSCHAEAHPDHHAGSARGALHRVRVQLSILADWSRRASEVPARADKQPPGHKGSRKAATKHELWCRLQHKAIAVQECP